MQKPDLSQYPDEPGVYLYKDVAGRIIYVGKARRLRRRLASYFREGTGLSAKTRLMLQHAMSIYILRTGTEKEALLLEASLIKKHRPRYNIVLRDDKEYMLFRIGSEHIYPRLELIRKTQIRGRDKGARYFGPFSSALAARETLRLIHANFPLRRCRDTAFANRTRPCLYFDMGQCLAPCVLPVPPGDYQAVVHKVLLLLSGKSPELLRTLRGEMSRASEELRFEDAAVLRDRIQAVERTVERQSVVLNSNRDIDLIGVAETADGMALGVAIVRGGLLLDGHHFFWPGLRVDDTPELLSGFLSQYYLNRRGFGESLPPRIVVPWLPACAHCVPDEMPASDHGDLNEHCEDTFADEDASEPEYCMTMAALEAALSDIRGGALHISSPKNQDEDHLSLMAASNAREAVKTQESVRMADLLCARLRTPVPVQRLEVVDISHTSGQQSRAGMVVFENESPVSEDFRAYKLDEDMIAMGAESGDDYAALAAWAARRVASGAPWPDLVLVDGGKGQLAAVERAFVKAEITILNRTSDLDRIKEQAYDASATDENCPDPNKELCGISLASIAKARDEQGRADRRAGNVGDRIFLPGRSNPLALAAGSRELLFLQRARDAAHDFVLGRHRRARAAAALTGELTRVPGIGPNLARQLFEHFGSLTAMAEAGEHGLLAVPGVGKSRAKAIAQRLATLLKKEHCER